MGHIEIASHIDDAVFVATVRGGWNPFHDRLGGNNEDSLAPNTANGVGLELASRIVAPAERAA